MGWMPERFPNPAHPIQRLFAKDAPKQVIPKKVLTQAVFSMKALNFGMKHNPAGSEFCKAIFNRLALLGVLVFNLHCTGHKTPHFPYDAPAPPPVLAPEQLESAIAAETNALRTHPARYADYLEAWLPYFQDQILALPGRPRLATVEGKKAVLEAIQMLRRQAAVSQIARSVGLSRAAADHVTDQRKRGTTGHEGSDGSHVWDRAERYGVWSGEIAENIAYGENDARGFILQWLVDDGVADRGHRKTLLDPQWRWMGVAIGAHPKYKRMCVMTFATQYQERTNP